VKRVVFGLIVVLLGAALFSSWALWSVAHNLDEARSALTGPAVGSSESDIARAQAHVRQAQERLEAFQSRFARFFPITRQNLDAMSAIVGELSSVLGSSRDLVATLEELEGGQLIADGAVRTAALERLADPLRAQVEAFDRLHRAVDREGSGWLLPPLWNELDDLRARAAELRRSADTALDVLEELDGMLGRESARTYLVVLLNNAELRGTGGLPSSVGTLTVDDGSVELGRFHYVGDLRGSRPYEKVRAPADFERRWGPYGANTTLWSNLTMSPDVPDVALVADRLFRLETGQRTDGVIFADPRGIAAMMSDSATVRVPGTTRVLTRDDVATYVYRDSYRELGGFSRRRRRAILTLGERAFRTIFRDGIPSDRRSLMRVGEAFGGGHIQFVPFRTDELAGLKRAGVTGDLAPPEGDSILVTAQATAAHKLDYYVDRSLEHVCKIDPDLASCTTSVTLVNEVPRGLSEFVAPTSPYGTVENFVEIYVPKDAELNSVELNGDRARFLRGRQDGHTSVGFDLTIGRGRSVTVSVTYELPLAHSYEMTVRPQPLARDASVKIRIDTPIGWHIRGPGTIVGSSLRYAGPLIRPVRVEARPRERAGISSVWEGLARFWSEPLF
jgi:hypothetical protein